MKDLVQLIVLLLFLLFNFCCSSCGRYNTSALNNIVPLLKLNNVIVLFKLYN